MKTQFNLFHARLFCAVALGSPFSLSATAADTADTAPAKTSIPWSQLGAKAGADYQGDGLAVIATAGGARLRCAFQKLEGEATREGLWLTSTVIPPSGTVRDRFRVVAADVRRLTSTRKLKAETVNEFQSLLTSAATRHGGIPRTGAVSLDGQTVRFTRPGLTEEYTVSMDGVRQDFIIEQRPVGEGPLRLELDVAGAEAEPLPGGAQLALENSGRKIAYSRLRVTDATGKELTARMEVLKSNSESRKQKAEICPALVVVVNDAEAVYPVRIDPAFSDANWSSMNPGIPGASGTVNAAVVDGSGSVYICGAFNVVGGVIANGIAKWNGSSWSALGSGIDRSVFALAVSGSDLYAGGWFTSAGGISANNIAKWDGSSWSALGSGVDNEVDALAVSGRDLYAAGGFTSAGGSAANYIAKWDGSSWSALGSGAGGVQFPYVSALAVSGSDLYAGGNFTRAGGILAHNIAKWDGTSWSALGSGISGGAVTALALSGSDAYAGGAFTRAGGSAANYIAKWDGSSWIALGSGLTSQVNALAVLGSDVYAGGYFTTLGGSAANYAAKWDGSSWTALGSGLNDTVNALALSGSNLYAGGYFRTAGGSGAANIAKWDGSSWTALGSGMNDQVNALAVSGSDVYAGGQFTTAGGSAATNIAKWNGSSWSALGSGMNYSVLALAVSGSDLYAGGGFTTGGDNIAKWDGSSWSALGSGLGGGRRGGCECGSIVYALAVSGSNVYAGGAQFTAAGGSAANSIAKWDGTSWSALGSGINGGVSALAVSGSDLYAGGYFTSAGGNAANSIAKWDGTSWTALGSGINGEGINGEVYVSALAVSGSDVYAGGSFTTAGGSAANYIAKWNGSSWATLGSGMNGSVSALAVSGSNVYAGGGFTTAGGSAANYIAKWDGSSWSALGSGIGGSDGYNCPLVSALAVSGSDLYAGGDFLTAGGKVSPYMARAYLPTLPTLSVLRSSIPRGGIMVSWPAADTASFTLEQARTLNPPPSWVTNAASITDDGTNKSVTLPATNNARLFRLRRP